MRHGYFFVLASAPESPNRTSFHRRQQAMPSRSMLAHPHHGPDHAPPSLILRELEGFDGGTASIATPPQAAADGLLLRVDVDSVRAQLRVTGLARVRRRRVELGIFLRFCSARVAISQVWQGSKLS